jgi:hypothetical protein
MFKLLVLAHSIGRYQWLQIPSMRKSIAAFAVDGELHC